MPTPAPDVAADRAEIAGEIERGLGDFGRDADVHPPRREISEKDLMAELDVTIAGLSRESVAPTHEPPFATIHAAAPAPIHAPAPPVTAAPEPAPAPLPSRIEPRFAPAPSEAPPVVADLPSIAAPVPPPAAAPNPVPAPVAPPAEAPRAPVDELEEEMARLLSELSGPPRR
ncbi:hypothetical protein EYW49_20110 [Siculibacillus lacustris]|uniref:Uncharacterized protein n=1 Tax=Siculibacillus lacustris TaxID=1549641 RepID=A0A4Q9VF36_9HYPH|nr:hypothetical protein [Siculibacillus lacustris]TBW33485.1 hypothetical protein EYW49_20110 [Siculibacillus lacustris]